MRVSGATLHPEEYIRKKAKAMPERKEDKQSTAPPRHKTRSYALGGETSEVHRLELKKNLHNGDSFLYTTCYLSISHLNSNDSKESY